MQFLDQKINVLKVGVMDESPPDAKRKWFRRTLQVFDGDLGGQLPVYGEKEILEVLQEGMHLVDVVSAHGERANLELRYTNVRPYIKPQPQQQQKP